MFERFTDDARRVIVNAQEECLLLRHRHIGTAHLLLGLLHDESDCQDVARLLAASGATLASVRQQVGAGTEGRGEDPSGEVPFTPRAKRALEQSLRVGIRLGQAHLAPAHLLLGLLEVRKATAVKVLQALDVDLDQLASAAQKIAARTDGWTDTRAVPVEAEPARAHRLMHERNRLAQALQRYGRHEAGCDPDRGCSCGFGDVLALAEGD